MVYGFGLPHCERSNNWFHKFSIRENKLPVEIDIDPSWFVDRYAWDSWVFNTKPPILSKCEWIRAKLQETSVWRQNIFGVAVNFPWTNSGKVFIRNSSFFESQTSETKMGSCNAGSVQQDVSPMLPNKTQIWVFGDTDVMMKAMWKFDQFN